MSLFSSSPTPLSLCTQLVPQPSCSTAGEIVSVTGALPPPPFAPLPTDLRVSSPRSPPPLPLLSSLRPVSFTLRRTCAAKGGSRRDNAIPEYANEPMIPPHPLPYDSHPPKKKHHLLQARWPCLSGPEAHLRPLSLSLSLPRVLSQSIPTPILQRTITLPSPVHIGGTAATTPPPLNFLPPPLSQRKLRSLFFDI